MKRFVIGLIAVLVLSIGASAQSAELFEKGLKRVATGDYEQALESFSAAELAARTDGSSDAVRARIHLNAGVCLYQLKRYEQARSEFERAVFFDDRYEKAFYSLGMTNAELGDWKAAADSFEAALRLNRRNGETWFDLAFAYLSLGSNKRAESAFRQSLRYGTTARPVSHNNIGVLLAMNGRTREAIAEFEAAIKLANGSFEAAEQNLRFCAASGSRKASAFDWRTAGR